MNYRILGKTGLKVSEIGLGTEYLNNQPEKIVIEVLKNAIREGINYFDIVFNLEEYLENIRKGINGSRENIYITHHLGSSEENRKYKKTRKLDESRKIFERSLQILNTSHFDILNLHFVTAREYDKIIGPKGLLKLALELKEEGKAKYIGISSHDPEVVIRASKHSEIEVIMTQVNIASHALPERIKMLNRCLKENVGIVAMKPFAGGKLLQKNKTVNFAKYQSGGINLIKKIFPNVNPVKCLAYVLSQIGISTTVPGVKNLRELKESLDYLNASREERDFSSLLKHFKEYRAGECVYCNHCLPCPLDINIAEVMKLYDLSLYKNHNDLPRDTEKILLKVKDCIECKKCTERCPFDVPILSCLREIKKIL
ncbi:MAG: hypothetical protein BAJALOKI2v1_310042 [Promethearchaeota archaeon]|nr:MAG: hypothetical protein BAJALOKI2v1_310042 [Candidatus Lokiarchaeota archaeon]